MHTLTPEKPVAEEGKRSKISRQAEELEGLVKTTVRRENRDLFLLSLRVLARVNQGQEPSRRELIILRRNATAGQEGLPTDELCCSLIRHELSGRDDAAEAVS